MNTPESDPSRQQTPASQVDLEPTHSRYSRCFWLVSLIIFTGFLVTAFLIYSPASETQPSVNSSPNSLYGVTDVGPVPLPPDPGEAGKQTLEGIDSDNDGVRDDVQRYIAITVTDSARHREALRQNAAVTQRILLAQTSEESIQLAKDSIHTIECLDYLGFIDQNIWKEVKALMINTPIRLQALKAHTSRISGQVFTTLSDAERATACTFDVSALPN